MSSYAVLNEAESGVQLGSAQMAISLIASAFFLFATIVSILVVCLFAWKRSRNVAAGRKVVEAFGGVENCQLGGHSPIAVQMRIPHVYIVKTIRPLSPKGAELTEAQRYMWRYPFPAN